MSMKSIYIDTLGACIRYALACACASKQYEEREAAQCGMDATYNLCVTLHIDG